MFTMRMAEISAVAGSASDGIVRGTVAQSFVTRAFTNVEGAETVYAFNVDMSGPNVYFTDYSAAASGLSGPNSFLPWGTDVQFSAGDAVYVASAEDVTRIRFTVDTPGVWFSNPSSFLKEFLTWLVTPIFIRLLAFLPKQRRSRRPLAPETLVRSLL